jgi:hypothetical protein
MGEGILLQQHTHCLSRVYGSTMVAQSNGVVIFVFGGAHARRVLVRLDHVAGFIVNPNHGVM